MKRKILFYNKGVDLEIASLKPLEDFFPLAKMNIRTPEVTMRRTKDGKIDNEYYRIPNIRVHTKRRYKDHKEHPTAKTKTSICIYR
jgi:hypothetical protein